MCRPLLRGNKTTIKWSSPQANVMGLNRNGIAMAGLTTGFKKIASKKAPQRQAKHALACAHLERGDVTPQALLRVLRSCRALIMHQPIPEVPLLSPISLGKNLHFATSTYPMYHRHIDSQATKGCSSATRDMGTANTERIMECVSSIHEPISRGSCKVLGQCR